MGCQLLEQVSFCALQVLFLALQVVHLALQGGDLSTRRGGSILYTSFI
jgi:hypothetical protein